MALSSLADCRTAEDVRRNAREVYHRAQARDQRLKAISQARAVMDAKPPEPPSQPEEIKPEPAIAVTDDQIEQWIRQHEDRMRAVLHQLDTERELTLQLTTGLPRAKDIIAICCKCFDTNKNEMLSSRHDKSVVGPRQIAMLLTKILTRKSLPEIGRLFGGRDHTTVLHAVRKFEWLKQKLEAELTLDDPVAAWAERAAYHFREAMKAK